MATIRESVLQFRYWRNRSAGIDSLLRKDKDELFASTTAGVAIGAGAGWIWPNVTMTMAMTIGKKGGPRAMPAGALMYAMIAFAGQSGLCLMRNMRLNAAVSAKQLQERRKLAEIEGNSQTQMQTAVESRSSSRWWVDPFRKDSDDSLMHGGNDHSWDPIGEALNWMFGNIKRKMNTEQSASPFLNAFDLDHRAVLNTKIMILESQIEALKLQIEKLEKTSGITVDSFGPSSADRSKITPPPIVEIASESPTEHNADNIEPLPLPQEQELE
eukprot:jgi/Hompol1/6114/HPOL_000707-RA